MYATMIVRANESIIKVYRVDNLQPVFGNPLTLTVLLINKYFDIKRHWVIEKLKAFNDLYHVDEENLKTVGDILDAATSNDIGDIEVIPKVKITEEVLNVEAV